MVNVVIKLPEPIELTFTVKVGTVQYFETHGKKRRLCTSCLKKLATGFPWIQAKVDFHWKPLCIECASEKGILHILRQQGILW